jgi:hypothetical protein
MQAKSRPDYGARGWKSANCAFVAAISTVPMIKNCAIYLPATTVDFPAFLPGGVLESGIPGRPGRYDYPTQAGPVRLNISYAADCQEHLRGMKAYVAQLENSDAAKQRAFALIQDVRMILGVILPAPVAPDSPVFSALGRLAAEHGGFMFVEHSLLTADGFLVGPMTDPARAAAPLAAIRIASSRTQTQQAQSIAPARAIRERSLTALARHGFVCAPGLPIGHRDRLRPAVEIARRFCALTALFLHVARPDVIATETLEAVVTRDALKTALTAEEGAILAKPRARAQADHRSTIGWKLENIWALAWALRFPQEPPFHSGQLPETVIGALIKLFPGPGQSFDFFVLLNKPRPAAEIVELEDRFYCAHNAVRSAQTGSPTVPPDFHPVVDGGAIHERRHALTWCLSPGVTWDDTDLST